MKTLKLNDGGEHTIENMMNDPPDYDLFALIEINVLRIFVCSILSFWWIFRLALYKQTCHVDRVPQLMFFACPPLEKKVTRNFKIQSIVKS